MLALTLVGVVASRGELPDLQSPEHVSPRLVSSCLPGAIICTFSEPGGLPCPCGWRLCLEPQAPCSGTLEQACPPEIRWLVMGVLLLGDQAAGTEWRWKRGDPH